MFDLHFLEYEYTITILICLFNNIIGESSFGYARKFKLKPYNSRTFLRNNFQIYKTGFQ